MNDHKICFIVCVNDDTYEKECLAYLQQLHVPAGYEMEQLSVREAASMTAGYAEGMAASDAKYKVYLHQDVFIVNKNFIEDLLNIFQKDEKIGLIGMVGSPRFPETGVMWSDDRVGRIYSCNIKEAGEAIVGEIKGDYAEVEAVDGLLLATQYDVPWRTDLFKGWDFYDISVSMEFRKKGYKVVVPAMDFSWCLHDDGYVNLEHYFYWRDIFMEEYKDMIYETN